MSNRVAQKVIFDFLIAMLENYVKLEISEAEVLSLAQ